jgi:two-component system NarL family response regulator
MNATAPIPVAILHHDALVRACLATWLRAHDDMELRAEVDTGVFFPAQDPSPRRGLVVVADPAHALAAARADRAASASHAATPAIVLVSGLDREWDLREALLHQVRGYLVAGFAPEQLAEAVRAAHRGARYLCGRAAARLAESYAFEALTEREQEVLALVVEGLCNKAIGRRLDISIGTVKSHLKSVYDKLRVVSRTQASAAAERRGLLQRHAGAAQGCAPEGPRIGATGDRWTGLRGQALESAFAAQ